MRHTQKEKDDRLELPGDAVAELDVQARQAAGQDLWLDLKR